MKVEASRIRVVLGFIFLSAMSCTFPNDQHCWVMQGDMTCKELLGGGFCSSDRPTCEGHGIPYGCVFARPIEDECYSPAGDNASCADSEPDPRCTSAEESGESGTSDMLDTSDTSSELAVCGDGIIEGDEQCDDGNPDNTDACTSLCTLAVCGDMFIHDGVEECDDANMDNADECTNYCTVAVCGDMTVEGPEECDDGDADNEDYCTAACRIAACGDGFVQPGETCDDGNQDMNDFCAGCQINGKFVFVTSEKYSGDLNGIGGADAICNAHAKVADLPGHYMAWISTNYVEENPDQRFSKSTKPYYLVNLVQVADDWVDLTDGTLDAPIDRTELNTDSPVTDMDCMGNFRTVRTGTASDGSLQGTQCGNFTYASVGMTSTIGSTLSWNSDWTACELSADQVCSIPMPIYCFEQ